MEGGLDFATLLRFALALAFVLAMIGILALVMRRLGLGGAVPARRGCARRLALVEALVLDQRHRLVLVRRDNAEHLVLLGQAGDLVVERGIVDPGEAQAAGSQQAANETGADAPADSKPDTEAQSTVAAGVARWLPRPWRRGEPAQGAAARIRAATQQRS